MQLKEVEVMIIHVVVREVFVGALGVLSRCAADLIVLHRVVEENLIMGVLVFDAGRQMRYQVMRMYYSVDFTNLFNNEVGEFLIS